MFMTRERFHYARKDFRFFRKQKLLSSSSVVIGKLSDDLVKGDLANIEIHILLIFSTIYDALAQWTRVWIHSS